jgi:hypothetical protein
MLIEMLDRRVRSRDDLDVLDPVLGTGRDRLASRTHKRKTGVEALFSPRRLGAKLKQWMPL